MNSNDYAGHALRQLVFDVLRRNDGEAAVVMQPVVGWADIAAEVPADPLAAAAAAKLLASKLRRLSAEYIRAGREAGRSWSEVARALRLNGEPDPGEAAFDYVAGEPYPGYSRPSTCWRCCSCGSRITDFGPQCGSHPDDRETGHSSSCRRHLEDIRAYMRHSGND